MYSKSYLYAIIISIKFKTNIWKLTPIIDWLYTYQHNFHTYANNNIFSESKTDPNWGILLSLKLQILFVINLYLLNWNSLSYLELIQNFSWERAYIMTSCLIPISFYCLLQVGKGCIRPIFTTSSCSAGICGSFARFNVINSAERVDSASVWSAMQLPLSEALAWLLASKEDATMDSRHTPIPLKHFCRLIRYTRRDALQTALLQKPILEMCRIKRISWYTK